MAVRGGLARILRAVAVWARARLALWIVTATAVTASAITLLVVLTTLPGQSDANVSGLILALLVLLILAVAFPVAGHQLEMRERSAAQNQRRIAQIDHLLVKGSSRQLPRLSHLGDDILGATPTRYSIDGHAPYVERLREDRAIRELLAAPGPPYPFVIVWGNTKAGKSRTLAEGLRATFLSDSDDPVVILPRDGAALAELSRLELIASDDGKPALVVLDDLALADLEALTSDVLDRVSASAVVAATMTAQRRSDVLQTGSAVGAVARTALEHRASQIELSSDPPTGAQREEAERLYPGERFHGSIAETLVGGRELIARYKASRDEQPAACAILRSAIDCRRAGLSRPVTEPELRQLFSLYLPMVRINLTPTDRLFRAGLEWAARPVASQVALLQQVDSDRPAWRVLDHAVSADEGRGAHQPRSIPAETWTQLIQIVTGNDALRIGFAAASYGDTDHEISAFRKASITGDYEEAPVGSLLLGTILAQQGVAAEAKAAFQQAIDSGHADAAPFAAGGLGIVLAGQGDAAGAELAYRQAIDSGHADAAAQAAVLLGGLLAERGDMSAARAVYQQAVDSGHADAAPKAAGYLGEMLVQQKDVPGAQAAFMQAIKSGHPEAAPKAAVNLAAILAQQGNAVAARAAYQAVIDSRAI